MRRGPLASPDFEDIDKQDAAEEIRSILETQKREEVYQEWLQGLRADARITVDWAQLEIPRNNS